MADCIYKRIAVYLNDVKQFSATVSSDTSFVLTGNKLIEALKNDVLTVRVLQEGLGSINFIPEIEIYRVTYITHKKDVGRNLADNNDELPGGGGTGGGGGSCSSCDPTTIPGPSGPQWYTDAIAAAGLTNCVTDPGQLAIEGAFNAQGFAYERGTGCNLRGRAYYDPSGMVTGPCGFLEATDFSQAVDFVRSDCGWGWNPR